jgi:hypothetical protein
MVEFFKSLSSIPLKSRGINNRALTQMLNSLTLSILTVELTVELTGGTAFTGYSNFVETLGTALKP